MRLLHKLLTVLCVLALSVTAFAAEAPYFTMTELYDGRYAYTQSGYLPDGTFRDFGGDSLKRPADVFVDELDRLFISDEGNDRVVMATLDGETIRVFGEDDFKVEKLFENNKQTESVFSTENISKITFYAYYGQGKGSVVPAENMTEMINWLNSITIARDATDEDVLLGTNTYHVEIEYADGTIIKEGLDVIVVDGTRYLLQKDKYPDCFAEIISKTSL